MSNVDFQQEEQEGIPATLKEALQPPYKVEEKIDLNNPLITNLEIPK